MWREEMAGRPRREECGGKKWRESAAGGEMAGERDLSAYGKLIGTYQLAVRRQVPISLPQADKCPDVTATTVATTVDRPVGVLQADRSCRFAGS